MHAWELAFVPLAIGAVSALLAVTTWLEKKILSPRSIIVAGIRVRNARPDYVEELVAAETEKLLRNVHR